MSEKDRIEYAALRADLVRYERYLERKRREARVRQRDRSYETERKRLWRQKNEGVAERIRQSGHAVEKALRAGDLTKGKECVHCGNDKRRLEAHHHKGYEQQFWLDVIWLCPPCHGKAHRIAKIKRDT